MPLSPRARATSSSRTVGYAFARTCFVPVQSGGALSPKQSQDASVQSFCEAVGSGKVHAYCKSTPFVSHSRPLTAILAVVALRGRRFQAVARVDRLDHVVVDALEVEVDRVGAEDLRPVFVREAARVRVVRIEVEKGVRNATDDGEEDEVRAARATREVAELVTRGCAEGSARRAGSCTSASARSCRSSRFSRSGARSCGPRPSSS